MGYTIGLIIAILFMLSGGNVFVGVIIGVIAGPLLEILLKPIFTVLYVAIGIGTSFKRVGSFAGNGQPGMKALIILPKGQGKGNADYFAGLYRSILAKHYQENAAFRQAYHTTVEKGLSLEVYLTESGGTKTAQEKVLTAWRKFLAKLNFNFYDGDLDMIFSEGEPAVVGYFFDLSLLAAAQQASAPEATVDPVVFHAPQKVKVPGKKLSKRTKIILAAVAVVVVAFGSVAYLHDTHRGPFAQYSDPFIITKADGGSISEAEYEAFEEAINKRIEARYPKDAARAVKMSRTADGKISLEANEYVFHEVRINLDRDRFPAFFAGGDFAVKTADGQTLLTADDVEKIGSQAGHYVIFWLNDQGEEKLAAAFGSEQRLTLDIYLDGELLSRETIDRTASPDRSPGTLNISMVPGGVDRFTPLQMEYTIFNPLPFAVELTGVEPVDYSEYLVGEETWLTNKNGHLEKVLKDDEAADTKY